VVLGSCTRVHDGLASQSPTLLPRAPQLGPLRSLLSLSQLSVEDNFITSFDGLQTLRSLMELYIGNNRIPALKVR
jgi:hypothetical protein